MTTNKTRINRRSGTTGLQIVDRLKDRPDIELLIADGRPQGPRQARRLANPPTSPCSACPMRRPRLVAAIGNADTVVIDASTAHRGDRLDLRR